MDSDLVNMIMYSHMNDMCILGLILYVIFNMSGIERRLEELKEEIIRLNENFEEEELSEKKN